MLDAENPVVKLCVAGMQAEADGAFAEAHALFEQAWAARQDNLDACIAAHYLARHQLKPERILPWNEAALRFAEAFIDERVGDERVGDERVGDERVGDERVGDAREKDISIENFFPSLYLNIGKAHEELGNLTVAHHFYQLAADKAAQLTTSLGSEHYTSSLHRGIAAGLRRTASP